MSDNPYTVVRELCKAIALLPRQEQHEAVWRAKEWTWAMIDDTRGTPAYKVWRSVDRLLSGVNAAASHGVVYQ